MALYGHRLLQIRQPEHASSSIEATIGSIITLPLVIMPGTRAAAAAPWATEAGMSLGPWQAPATNTPSVIVATGSSFGCRSVYQPAMLHEMPHFRPSLLGVGLRLQRAHQDHHVDRDPPLLAQQGVFAPGR